MARNEIQKSLNLTGPEANVIKLFTAKITKVHNKLECFVPVYDNDFTSIIDIYFYGTFLLQTSFKKALMLRSLDTLSDVRIKAFMLLF